MDNRNPIFTILYRNIGKKFLNGCSFLHPLLSLAYLPSALHSSAQPNLCFYFFNIILWHFFIYFMHIIPKQVVREKVDPEKTYRRQDTTGAVTRILSGLGTWISCLFCLRRKLPEEETILGYRFLFCPGAPSPSLRTFGVDVWTGEQGGGNVAKVYRVRKF